MRIFPETLDHKSSRLKNGLIHSWIKNLNTLFVEIVDSVVWLEEVGPVGKSLVLYLALATSC
jgi:hypothetical protein